MRQFHFVNLHVILFKHPVWFVCETCCQKYAQSEMICTAPLRKCS